MMMKRIAAVALSGVLLAGALAGCTKNEGGSIEPPTSPTASTEPAASGSPAPSPEAAAIVETEDVVQKLVGIPRDAEAFSVNGQSVSMEDYLYWMCYVLDSVSYSVGGAQNIVWDEEQEGETFSQYTQKNALDMAKLYQVVLGKAAENGITLSAEDEVNLNAQIVAANTQSGGDEGYKNALQQVCRSDEGLRRMYSVSYLFSNLQDQLFPPEEITDEALSAWCDTEGKMQVKHILIKTVDDQGQELPEEGTAAAKAKAEGLLEQLRASDDPETLFDQLMNENSEDGRDPSTGSLYAPDGYFFGAGEMVQEFEDASKALQIGEISDLVKSTYGYHIILRLPVNMTEARSAWEQAQTAVVQNKMDEQVNEWMESAVVETSENYDAVDPKAFYEKLTAYRDELTAAQEPEPSASAAPGESPAAETTPAPAGE